MARYVYPHKISLDTIPKRDKYYGFWFGWKATEDLTERNISDALDVLSAYFKEKYPTSWVEMWGHRPLRKEIRLNFVAARYQDFGLSLREVWDEMRAFALEHYLDLTLDRAVIYKPRFPWWLLGIAAVEAGGIVYVAKKK